MKQNRLPISLLTLSILLFMISFIPSTILSEHGTIIYETSAYHGYPIQCPENPHLFVDVRNDKLVSLYIMTIEESARLIEGIPIENITITFSLVNISEYSGSATLGDPGFYFLFITTFNQSDSSIEYDFLDYDLRVSRSIPYFWPLITGLIFLVLAITIQSYQSPKLKRLLNLKKSHEMNRNQLPFFANMPN